MSYKQAETNNFAEFQFGEGFKSSVTGQTDAKFGEAQNNKAPLNLQKLAGYEGYPKNYAGFEDENESINVSNMQGFGDSSNMDAFAGIEDNAFAGYEYNIPRNSALKSDLGESGSLNGSELLADGYGTLSGTPLESFHTHFHKASTATGEREIIDHLRKAVKSVADNTPESVKKDYYDMIMSMLNKRQSLDHLSYLDIQRIEIEANVGWLINKSLPKEGGFQAMLNKSIGFVGAALSKGDDKNKNLVSYGNKLKNQLQRSGGLSGISDIINIKYAKFGVLGLIIAGIVWYLIKKDKVVSRRSKK